MDTTSDQAFLPLSDDPVMLRETVLSLQSEIRELALAWDEWQQRTELLTEQLRLLRAKIFGRSSEKRPSFEHPSLFNEAEQDADGKEDEATDTDRDDSTTGQEAEATAITVSGHTRSPKGRKPLSPDLPREEVIHDLPADQKICGLDGHELMEIGREISEQLEIVPAHVKVLQHIRIKYGCPHCRQGVKIAPPPRRPLPKAMASASMLAYIAVSKYADALPLYRQEGIFKRYGLDVSRTTLANWMIGSGQMVQPLINLMQERMLEYGYIRMDETALQVLDEPGKAATSKSYMWVRVGGSPAERVILFNYDASRGGQVPKELLLDYQGWLQTDGYDGYLAIGAQPGVEHLGCWAHVRRKFVEAVTAAGKGGKHSKAQQGVAWIAKLYAIEKRIRGRTPQERFEVRKREVPPIFKDIRAWMDALVPRVLPSSLTGQALGYMQGQWDRLIRYIEDGRLEIDNNGAENAIRPFVVGRKNWLFSDTVRGAKSSANLYSLIETAKANGLEPYAYLCHVFDHIPTAQTLEDFEALLPWKFTRNVQPEIKAAS
ncbi:MAG: IS66 family transposase [Magnetococcales bacterium]|nr:IS66 family transposase [Magnetococcales bacterium]